MDSKPVSDRQYKIESQSEKRASIQPARLASHWHRIWQFLSHHLLRGNEPRVWQVRDPKWIGFAARSNNVRWRVYDPQSGRSFVCSSEQEVRIWLEQLHHR